MAVGLSGASVRHGSAPAKADWLPKVVVRTTEVQSPRVAARRSGFAVEKATAVLQSDEFSKRLRCSCGPANAFAANTEAETATNKTVNDFAKQNELKRGDDSSGEANAVRCKVSAGSILFDAIYWMLIYWMQRISLEQPTWACTPGL